MNSSDHLRCVYCDLDGTLLGRNGSVLHDQAGEFTLLGVRALEACSRAGVEVVIFSGRRKISVAANARILGQSSFIYEVGCGLVVDGEEEVLVELRSDSGLTVYEQIARSGAPDLLLNYFPGQLSYHTPWQLQREFSHIFVGLLDLDRANAVLHENGHDKVRLLDNGVVEEGAERGIKNVRVYHLVPKSVSKARAVVRHMQIRGYSQEQCIAVGDSREDLDAAAVVGTFWLVGNAVQKDPTLMHDFANLKNVRVTDESNGAGVYEAVMQMLVTQ